MSQHGEHVTPEQAMRRATEEMIIRAATLGGKKGRSIFISKSAKGKGVDVSTLDPRKPGGRQNLDAYLSSVSRHYTFSGLGAPEEPNAVSWRQINLSPTRRFLVMLQVAASFFMKGTPLKNRLYRRMG